MENLALLTLLDERLPLIREGDRYRSASIAREKPRGLAKSPKDPLLPGTIVPQGLVTRSAKDSRRNSSGLSEEESPEIEYDDHRCGLVPATFQP
jgi:hypothetical protein